MRSIERGVEMKYENKKEPFLSWFIKTNKRLFLNLFILTLIVVFGFILSKLLMYSIIFLLIMFVLFMFFMWRLEE